MATVLVTLCRVAVYNKEIEGDRFYANEFAKRSTSEKSVGSLHRLGAGLLVVAFCDDSAAWMGC